VRKEAVSSEVVLAALGISFLNMTPLQLLSTSPTEEHVVYDERELMVLLPCRAFAMPCGLPIANACSAFKSAHSAGGGQKSGTVPCGDQSAEARRSCAFFDGVLAPLLKLDQLDAIIVLELGA
jgi:hypothetical protein